MIEKLEPFTWIDHDIKQDRPPTNLEIKDKLNEIIDWANDIDAWANEAESRLNDPN